MTLAGDGAHSIVARDTDAAGNTGTSNPVVFTLDTVAPTVTISTAAETSNVAAQTIAGTVTPAEAAIGRDGDAIRHHQRRHQPDRHGDRRHQGRLEHQRDAGRRRRPLDRGQGHRRRRQYRDQHPVVFTLNTVAPTVTISTASETSNVATQTIAGTVSIRGRRDPARR